MPIGTISLNFKDSPFIKELRARRASFQAKPLVAYKIVVPDDLKWWYWLEFGTAGRQDADAPYRTSHSGTYPIEPVNAKALHFETAGGPRFAFHVDHPGIKPRLIYRGVRQDILSFARAVLSGSLRNGVRVSSLNEVLSQKIMPYAVAAMGKRLDEQAPGVKASGNNPFKGPRGGAKRPFKKS